MNAALRASYNTDDDGQESGFPGWLGQTFTPALSGFTKSVKLKLWRVGTPGSVPFALYATSGGLPTGAALCSGTIAADTLTAVSPGDWRWVSLDPGTFLTAGVMYAIIATKTGDVNNHIWWRADKTAPAYSGGTSLGSADGIGWTAYPNTDYMFEVWGLALLEAAIVALDSYVESNLSAKITDLNNKHGDALLETPKAYYLGNVPQELPESPSVCFQGDNWTPVAQTKYHLANEHHINLYVYVGDQDATVRFRKLCRWAQAMVELLNDGEAAYGYTHAISGPVAISDTLNSPSFLQAVRIPVTLKKAEGY